MWDVLTEPEVLGVFAQLLWWGGIYAWARFTYECWAPPGGLFASVLF